MSNFLVGRILTGLKVTQDRKALMFHTDQGDVVVKVEGECCSDSWIEDIELPAGGFPAKVLEVEDLDMPETDELIKLKFYGCKITTDKGDLVIDYRNASNGYYGGNLFWPDEHDFYGGVSGQNISNEDWIEIGEWSLTLSQAVARLMSL